jgi:thiol-disulfide isomerase/thioredoxin
MKMNIYLLVFCVVGAIIIVAALSTIVFTRNLSPENTSVANLTDYGAAADIQGISGWINSAPINISQLRGKVVIVDFWTYSCINCIRSIPHLEAWYKAYGNNGLVIIGVHTPEFQFERNYTNVESAVQRFGITYPVALDNDYSTWDAYHNEYWPADYIIDKNGRIRYETFGEGDYNSTEEVIRELLVNAGYTIQPNLTSVPLGVNFSGIETPEIYLGYARARQPLGNGQGFSPDKTVNYTITGSMETNVAYLSGEWYNAPDSMIAVSNAKIFLTYKAKSVNIVASNSSVIIVGLDGKNLSAAYLGNDDMILDGEATARINVSRLYNIVDTPSYGWHTVEINASPGFRIYTFTFG